MRDRSLRPRIPHATPKSPQRTGPPPDAARRRSIKHENEAVEGAPQHERPRGSMPQPPQQHGQQKIPIRLPRAVTISAQGNIEIVAQPRREADMPPPPELRRTSRNVRQVEVQHNIKTQETSRAPGNIRVS